MKNWLSLVLVATSCLPAAAGSLPSASEAHWAAALETGRAALLRQAPKTVPVDMTVERAGWRDDVRDPGLGVSVSVERPFGGSLQIDGDLKASAHLYDRRSTVRGVSIMGDGVNVDVRPFGDSMFILGGVYRDAAGKDRSLDVRLNLLGLPVRDMSVHENGLDLDLAWNGSGYRIQGQADPRLYGRRELAVLGAAVAAVTWDVFGR